MIHRNYPERTPESLQENTPTTKPTPESPITLYINRESHYVTLRHYLLILPQRQITPQISLKSSRECRPPALGIYIDLIVDSITFKVKFLNSNHIEYLHARGAPFDWFQNVQVHRPLSGRLRPLLTISVIEP